MLAGIAMMPHGNDVLAPKDDETRYLAEVLRSIGEVFRTFDAYVLATPHNVRMSDHLGVIFAKHLVSWLGFAGVELPGEYETDRELARLIYEEARKAGLPVVDINFASLSGEYSRFPLSWGELIPLHFLEKRPLVVVTPARKVSRDTLVRFGEVIAEVVESYPKKVGLIISADHGHAHDPNGPYGYAPESKEYDALIMQLIRENRLGELLNLDEGFIERAKPDSYWQLLIMLGALRNVPMTLRATAYACPTYFGMGAALYLRE
ncbi:DODA-type extradiol aromatic ring-opening family dioxygenase [Pyrococcus yayanosii]|uniref:Predicted dioxygenase n=1 Tax=Pyrococcus yayanosii (strain CH1 / JCM 16557) TaxID=529709 RepID=F8AJ85_PYRYC|nr:extradiol dioxygenase [Pyrococcus yayanosii]AEH24526.1 Predicted dioxygenase [Pyrococcus yayanosii CH1]